MQTDDLNNKPARIVLLKPAKAAQTKTTNYMHTSFYVPSLEKFK